MSRFIRFPLSKLSLSKLSTFRNDVEDLEERVRLYNDNILRQRKDKRNEKIRNKRKENKIAELRNRNLEYFRKKEEAQRNSKIHAFKEKRSAKLIFRNLQKVLDNSTTYDILIDMMLQIYWKKAKKSYDTADTISSTFTCRKQNLKNKIEEMLSDLYPYEDDYKIVTLVEYKFSIKEEFTHRIDKKDVFMKSAIPYEASYLYYMNNVHPVCLQDGNGQCVINALSEHLRVKGKPMNKDNLRNKFNEAGRRIYGDSYNPERGITANMILHFCKDKQISCLGFDQNNKLFIKHTSDRGSKNYRAIIFYMFLNHFYLITDESVIRHISHSFKESSVIRTHLQCENHHKTDKVIQFYSNLSVKEALSLPENSVVIYEKYNLNDEFKEYIKITNDAKPVLKYGSKTSIHKIVSKNKVTLTISGCLGEGIDWKSIKLICEKIIWSFIINLLEVY